MFGALKSKLGKALNVFSKKVVEESEEIEVVEQSKEQPTKKSKEEIIHPTKPKKKEIKSEKKEVKEKSTKKQKEVEQLSEQPTEKEKQKVTISTKPKKEEEKIESQKESVEIKETEKIGPEQEQEQPKKSNEKKGFLGIFKKKEKSPSEIIEEETKEVGQEQPKEKKSFFKKPLIKINISEKKFEELFWDIELALLENNVAVEVIEKLKSDLKENLLNHKLNAFALQKKVQETFQTSISELFDIPAIDLQDNIKQKKPYVIAFIGVNGSGKTTSLAKVAHMLKKQGISIVIAACDNFRAAALHQIEEHANNLDIKLIKHAYGSDSAAVAFDAIKHAESKGIDVVLIDTAGRSHSNINLMDELKKVIRVSKPDLKIFVGDSLTGNDTVDQAKSFDEAVGIDALILSKMDIDEKGGASISVSYVTKKPILFNGTGQEYSDLEVFDKNKIINALDF